MKKEIKKGQSWRIGYQSGYQEAIKDVKEKIVKEILIARKEGQPTSRLTSLYNKISKA